MGTHPAPLSRLRSRRAGGSYRLPSYEALVHHAKYSQWVASILVGCTFPQVSLAPYRYASAITYSGTTLNPWFLPNSRISEIFALNPRSNSA